MAAVMVHRLKPHGTALTLRNLAHAPTNRSSWSHAALKSQRELLAANGYRDLKVPSRPAVRVTMLGSLMEIEQATAAAITGIAPDAFQWGSVDGGGIFDDPAGRDHMGADSFRTCSILVGR